MVQPRAYHIFSLFRSNAWWQAKTPLLLAIIFAEHLAKPQQKHFIVTLLIWFCSYLMLSCFGYWINDCFDIVQDQKAGKKNAAAAFHPLMRFFIATILAAGSLAPWYFHAGSELLLVMLSIQMLLLLLYSIPGIRLKNSILSIVIDACYSYTIPILITHFAFNHTFSFPTPALLAWATVAGMRNIFIHHIQDRDADYLSNSYNTANKYTAKAIYKLIFNMLLPVECLLFLLAFSSSIAAFAVALLLILIFSIQFFRKRLGINITAPNALYQNLLPLCLAGCCAVQISPWYFIYIPLHLTLFNSAFLDRPRQHLRRYYNIFVYRMGIKKD